jgi:hypothetical protein
MFFHPAPDTSLILKERFEPRIFNLLSIFKPDRWPLGDPYLLDTPKEPGFALLENKPL